MAQPCVYVGTWHRQPAAPSSEGASDGRLYACKAISVLRGVDHKTRVAVGHIVRRDNLDDLRVGQQVRYSFERPLARPRSRCTHGGIPKPQ